MSDTDDLLRRLMPAAGGTSPADLARREVRAALLALERAESHGRESAEWRVADVSVDAALDRLRALRAEERTDLSVTTPTEEEEETMTDPQQTRDRLRRAYAGEDDEQSKPPVPSWDGGAREPAPIEGPTGVERLAAAYEEAERYGR